MGGEKSPRRFLSRAAQGSPPRGRGKAGHGVEGGQHLGITPAWAGKRSSLDGKMFKIWDHPRVGGEKSISCWKRSMPVGSPPRGRGKGLCAPAPPRGRWITPAWAGKSWTPRPPSARRGDHPRVGGEKALGGAAEEGFVGSPPRGRGKVRVGQDVDEAPRITPAWAGKSFLQLHLFGGVQDHPRVGGEKSSHVGTASNPLGSPPRGRGKGRPAQSCP